MSQCSYIYVRIYIYVYIYVRIIRAKVIHHKVCLKAVDRLANAF